ENSSNSRRDFSKKAGLGAATSRLGGLASPASSYARIKGANDRLNIARIGCFRRINAVMDSMPGLSNDLNISYVCDVDQKRMSDGQAKVNEKMGYLPKMEEDIRKILEDKSVDAVYLAIPDHWHVPAAIMALQAGKH